MGEFLSQSIEVLRSIGFNVEESLGKGGFSFVVCCSQEGKKYAVKIQHIITETREKNLEKIYTFEGDFFSEAAISKRLMKALPGKVPVFEGATTIFAPSLKRNLGIYVMDCWDGSLFNLIENIAERHGKRRKVALKKLMHYGEQAVCILRDMRAKNFVHYDARPCNFLFRGDIGGNEEPEPVELVVSDFGHTFDYNRPEELDWRDGFRFYVKPPEDYDIAMFQFSMRGDAFALGLPIRDLVLMENSRYIELIQRHAIADQWVVLNKETKRWLSEELRRFKNKN